MEKQLLTDRPFERALAPLLPRDGFGLSDIEIVMPLLMEKARHEERQWLHRCASIGRPLRELIIDPAARS